MLLVLQQCKLSDELEIFHKIEIFNKIIFYQIYSESHSAPTPNQGGLSSNTLLGMYPFLFKECFVYLTQHCLNISNVLLNRCCDYSFQLRPFSTFLPRKTRDTKSVRNEVQRGRQLFTTSILGTLLHRASNRYSTI